MTTPLFSPSGSGSLVYIETELSVQVTHMQIHNNINLYASQKSLFFSLIDTEAPTCHYCPSDIVLHNATSSTIRVNWATPNCSDNSGLPPSIRGNRNRGDQFGVPGKYEIIYAVTDDDGNEGNCTFAIDLARKCVLLSSK